MTLQITKAHTVILIPYAGLRKLSAYKRSIPSNSCQSINAGFTGCACSVVDNCLLEDQKLSGKERMQGKINLYLIPVDLVIDHSVQVDFSGTNYSYEKNVEVGILRRKSERYKFLKWAQKSFDNFSVVPPGWGSATRSLRRSCKGVNVKDGNVFPDTLVGPDFRSTPMVNDHRCSWMGE